MESVTYDLTLAYSSLTPPASTNFKWDRFPTHISPGTSRNDGMVDTRATPRAAAPPADIAADARMLKMWRRSKHILPSVFFEKRYWGTVCLPVKTTSVRRAVTMLGKIMSREDHPTQDRLVKLAASEVGLSAGLTTTILRMRRGLEWEWLSVGEPSRKYSFSPVRDSQLLKLMPIEIPVEYLVAELERHGFEFWVQGERNDLLFRAPSNALPSPELDAWFESHGSEIAEYATTRA
jgi:hypothetical protein